MSDMIYCGGKTCYGHGDYAVCGEVYWDGVYQCDSCRAKQKEKIVEELEKKLAVSQREFRAADATIENLQMQLNAEREAKLALAAESAGLKATLEEIEVINRGGQAYCVKDGMSVNPIYARGWNDYRAKALSVETPATEAVLAEVRAQGVDALVERRLTAARLAKEAGHEITARDLEGEAIRARFFACELRKGVQS